MIILRQKEYSTGSKLLAGAALIGGTALGAAIGGSIKPKVTDKDIESEIEYKKGIKNLEDKEYNKFKKYENHKPTDKEINEWCFGKGGENNVEDKEELKLYPMSERRKDFENAMKKVAKSKHQGDKQIEKLKNRDPEALEDIKRTKKNANKVLGGMAGLGVAGAGLLTAKIIGKHKKKDK